MTSNLYMLSLDFYNHLLAYSASEILGKYAVK